MKTKPIILSALFSLIGLSVFSQDLKLAEFISFDSLKKTAPKTDSIFRRYNQHVSPEVLNLFFNKQISRQLSGKEDLALSKTFAIVDEADGELTIGGSFGFGKTKKDYIPYVLQFGARFKSKDKFAEIFDSNDGFAGSAGVFFKGTYLFPGRLTYGYALRSVQEKFQGESGDERIATVQNYERFLSTTYEKEYIKERDKIQAELDAYAKTHNLSDEQKKALSTERLKKAKKAEYAEEVVDYMVENKLFAGSHKSWISLDGFFAVRPTEFFTAPDLTSTAIDTLPLRPHTVNLTASYLYTRRNGFVLFLSGWYGLKWQNSITRDDMSAVPFYKFVERDETNPEIEHTQTDKTDVYVGDIDTSIVTSSINGKVTAMFGGDFSFVGLSGSGEYRITEGDDLWYWKVGVPFNLKGKEDDTRLNIEPQLRWDTSNKDWSFGLSLGVPFGKPLF